MSARDRSGDEHRQRRLGRVGDRRDRVGREDRERERLREQRLVELAGRSRAADQDSLRSRRADTGGGAESCRRRRRLLLALEEGQLPTGCAATMTRQGACLRTYPTVCPKTVRFLEPPC